MPDKSEPRPRFSDPLLQQALEEHAPNIEAFTANLSAMSQDIKALEAWLESSGVRIRVSTRYHQEGMPAYDHNNSCSRPYGLILSGCLDLEDSYAGECSRFDEFVEWAPSENEKGRWRIMYRRMHERGEVKVVRDYVAAGPTWDRGTDVTDFKPLIEAPADVRLRAYKVLPDLLKAVASKVAVKRVEIPKSE